MTQPKFWVKLNPDKTISGRAENIYGGITYNYAYPVLEVDLGENRFLLITPDGRFKNENMFPYVLVDDVKAVELDEHGGFVIPKQEKDVSTKSKGGK